MHSDVSDFQQTHHYDCHKSQLGHSFNQRFCWKFWLNVRHIIAQYQDYVFLSKMPEKYIFSWKRIGPWISHNKVFWSFMSSIQMAETIVIDARTIYLLWIYSLNASFNYNCNCLFGEFTNKTHVILRLWRVKRTADYATVVCAVGQHKLLCIVLKLAIIYLNKNALVRLRLCPAAYMCQYRKMRDGV